VQNAIRLEGFDTPSKTARILPFDEGDLSELDGLNCKFPDSDVTPDLASNLEPEVSEAELEIEALQSLAATLSAMSKHVDSLHAGMTEELVTAIGEAVSKSLPSVLEEGFAAEVASVTRSIMTRMSDIRIQLRIAPVHHESLVAAFEGIEPALLIEIIDDEHLNPGQARLDWGLGGAMFDADDWSDAARSALKRQLEQMSTRRRDDD